MAKTKKAATTEKSETNHAAKKTTCPITRDCFLENANAISVKVGDKTIDLEPREFSTKTLGYMGGDKVVIVIDGVEVKCQVDVKVYVVGSKDLA